MKQIIVNVSGLSVEEKQRVNEALAKIKSLRMCDPLYWDKTDTLYGPSVDGVTVGFNYRKEEYQTHTPQQVLEMAGMAKQGHVHAHAHAHAESMALYAEDAKTTDKPWELWQVKDKDGVWWPCTHHPIWGAATEYRRKPKTHTVNGVEVPDLRFEPKNGEEYWFPDASTEKLVYGTVYGYESTIDTHRVSNNLCYEPTEEGKQAAILHAKAWLGIA